VETPWLIHNVIFTGFMLKRDGAFCQPSFSVQLGIINAFWMFRDKGAPVRNQRNISQSRKAASGSLKKYWGNMKILAISDDRAIK